MSHWVLGRVGLRVHRTEWWDEDDASLPWLLHVYVECKFKITQCGKGHKIGVIGPSSLFLIDVARCRAMRVWPRWFARLLCVIARGVESHVEPCDGPAVPQSFTH